jgi:hypothetical protein
VNSRCVFVVFISSSAPTNPINLTTSTLRHYERLNRRIGLSNTFPQTTSEPEYLRLSRQSGRRACANKHAWLFDAGVFTNFLRNY